MKNRLGDYGVVISLCKTHLRNWFSLITRMGAVCFSDVNLTSSVVYFELDLYMFLNLLWNLWKSFLLAKKWTGLQFWRVCISRGITRLFLTIEHYFFVNEIEILYSYVVYALLIRINYTSLFFYQTTVKKS